MKYPNRYHLWAALECHAFSKAEAVLRFSAEEDGMWVQWQDYAHIKAENARLRKAGDAVALDYAERIEIEAGETAKTLMKTVPVLREWNAAKEGKPSV